MDRFARDRQRLAPALLRPGSVRWMLLAAYAALGLAWVFSDPPFSGPDEAAHFLRAVGISDGALIGARTNAPPLGVDAAQQQTTARETRAVVVPPRLSPTAFSCEIDDPSISAACTEHAVENTTSIRETTYVGTYEPLPYVLPALVLRAAHHASGALRLARLAVLATWLALLSVAIWMLWDASVGPGSLIGILVAVTPMVVFLGASMTDSSDEIMASLAFFAVLVRLGRTSERAAPRKVWMLAAVCGVLLALSRPLGPVWILFDVLVAVALVGAHASLEVLRRQRNAALATAGTIVVAVALNRYWETTYEPHVVISLLPGLHTLTAGARELRAALGDFVGNFGYRNVPLSPIAVCAWGLAAAAVVAVALFTGTRTTRLALAGCLFIAVAFPIYFFAASLRYVGFGLQGRYVLPFVVTVPLTAGEMLRRTRHRPAASRTRRLLPPVALIAGIVQLSAWWTDAHRYAVGTGGPTWFLGAPQWSPPAGWLPWAALAFAGSLLIALCWIPHDHPSETVNPSRDPPSPAPSHTRRPPQV